MTSRERLLTTIRGEIPDCVPVSPDVSNMVPCKMTGLPFWDIYLYQKIPQWKAYIDCAKYFDFDSLMDGYAWVTFEDIGEGGASEWKESIVKRTDDRIVTRMRREANGKQFWSDRATVYYIADPPTHNVSLKVADVDETPSHWEDVVPKGEWPQGEELIRLVMKEMGDQGLVGISCGTSVLLNNEQQIYDYYDDPEPFREQSRNLLHHYERRFHRLMQCNPRPDFICTGGSGTLVTQTPEIFRELGLPIVKRITQLCKENGIPSHVHSCGPEAQLVKIMYEETDLTVIDPLEIPPMGNCNLRELKKLYGDKLVLKGNIHTTNVMLFGTPDDVRDACKRAIDDAAEGGRFILSTGDQCGRDTPFENLYAMIETARTYGKY